MSVLDCISRLARAGKITDKQARDARDLYGKVLSDDLLREMPQSDAEAYAALKTAEILQENAKARKREPARGVNDYIRGSDRIRAHPDGPLAGYMGMFGPVTPTRHPARCVEPGQPRDGSGECLRVVRVLLALAGL